MASSGELAVIASYFNPCGYQSRKKNLDIFLQHLKRDRIHLFLAELAFPSQEFVVSSCDPDVTTFRFRAESVLWHKERLLNLVVERLPARYTKVAWLDTDILFNTSTWFEQASERLDTYPLIQLFQSALQLDNDGNPIGNVSGRAWHVAQGKPTAFKFHRSHTWPGLAWAARRELLSRHGLFDRFVVGGGDTYMSLGAFGLNHDPWRWHARRLAPRLRRAWQQWALAFAADVRNRVGFVRTDIVQLGHGSLAGRQYVDRLRILTAHDYDPAGDLRCGSGGVWQWSSPKPAFHRAVENYFFSRSEDDSRP